MRTMRPIDLAAEAESDGCVEESGDEREAGGVGTASWMPARPPISPMPVMINPTSSAKRGGAASSVWAGGARQGRMSFVKTRLQG